MSVAQIEIDRVLPDEYRLLAADLYGALAEDGDGLTVALRAIAEALGIQDDYGDLSSSEKRIISHFRNNVELLIQKTWVEKADEAHKEKLLDRVPAFLREVETENFSAAVDTFGHIIDELGYLLFGVQSRRADFIEYAFRIDPQLGLFWWYSAAMSALPEGTDTRLMKPVIFVAICYLSDF